MSDGEKNSVLCAELEVGHLSTDVLLNLMQTWRERPGLRSTSVNNL